MSKFSDDSEFVCPVFASSRKCDQDALQVMEQFKEFYEEKLGEVDTQGGGDCLEIKLKIQRRWIEDLTEQTQMMARIVKELEDEATARVRMLEDKLKQTSKSAYEVMKRYQAYSISHNLDEPFQRVFYLENDLKNVLEFLRRVREDKQWSIEGLQFYDVTCKDLFGKDPDYDQSSSSNACRNSNGLCPNKQEAPPSEDPGKPENVDHGETQDHVTSILKKKDEEYEELRRSMLDMRTALTEEVACKHDMISALRKDVQQLEERCLQSDKQTAFKDDIIKELRKEIKQVKQQNKDKEEDLQKQLDEAKKTIKRMKPCVNMASACTDMDDEAAVIKKSKLIQNKDDIIQIQNDTLNVIERELQAAKERERNLEDEISRRQSEVDDLKDKCKDLETKLANSQGRAENLQNAVDLYINSVNVLEAAEEKARIEIEQQKMTITNLQEALIAVKQELDDLRQNSHQEIGYYQYLCNVFYGNVMDLEERNRVLENELLRLKESYKRLQDCSFELEIEHFNALQDLAILESQLYKYQAEFRNYEELKGAKLEIKKFNRQIQYYERVCACFKHEMSSMAEQLANLQDILNLSNQSCKEESCQLYGALHDLQKLNEKLQNELNDTEKKVLIENQRNLEKDAKIGELQIIIGQKNADLNVHDEAINDIKRQLDHAMIEKHQLQATVASLNSTIAQLECHLKNKELERSRRSKSGLSHRRSHSDSRSDSERRRKRDAEHYEAGKVMQRELERVKEKNREKIRRLKHANEELKEKLGISETNNKRLNDQNVRLKKEVAQTSEKQCAKDHELAQSKQIIIEMRQTLIELNESLADNELHQTILVEEYHKHAQEKSQQEDIYLSCRCEIALYKKLAESFQTALTEARKNLCDCEAQRKHLAEELKAKEAKIAEIHKRASKKDKESCQCIEELKEKLKESKDEEQRLNEFIDNMKKQVQKKMEEKKEPVQKVVVRCCNCSNINATQEEINSLKIEIKDMIQNQLELNTENDKLLKQVGSLQATLQVLEEKNYNLKQKFEMLQNEYQNLKEKNKVLLREKEVYIQTIRNLEGELTETKNTRDDLCIESRCVVNNVKAWLEEQKKINDQVIKKTQCYCDTIKQLKQANKNLLYPQQPVRSVPCRPRQPKKYDRGCADDCTSRPKREIYYDRGCTDNDCSNMPKYENNYERGCTDNDCPTMPKFENNYERCCTNVNCQNYENSWGLDSQAQSLRNSPMSCICSVEEWYSPNYRDEEEEDAEEAEHESEAEQEQEAAENEFIDRIAAATNEIKITNMKMEKHKRCPLWFRGK